jgi:hypothetical protein
MISLKETVGKTILIVGHSNYSKFYQSNNQPKYITDIPDSTFGNLYIVTIISDVITHQLLKLQTVAKSLIFVTFVLC